MLQKIVLLLNTKMFLPVTVTQHTVLVIYIFSSRHFHCDTGSECIWFREVSSETVSFHWAVLDGRQHGNDNTQHPFACTAL